MKKRLLSLALTLCMLLSLLPVAALAGDAYTAITEAITITAETPDKTWGNGSVSWVKEEKILTLNNADITADGSNGITLPQNSTIVLEGSNTIAVSGSGHVVSGAGTMRFQGSGNLTGNAAIDDGISNSSGTIVFEGTGKIQITANHLGIVTQDGNIEIKSGTIDATGGNNSGTGIYLTNGIIDITGGDVTATGTKNAGIYASAVDGDPQPASISITGGKVVANGYTQAIVAGSTAENSETLTITIGGTADVTAIAQTSNGLWAFGKLTISGGKVHVTAEKTGQSAIRSSKSDIEISGNTQITAISKARGLYANVGRISISDTAVVTPLGETIDVETTTDTTVAPTAKLNALVQQTTTNVKRTFTVFGEASLKSDLAIGSQLYTGANSQKYPATLAIPAGTKLTINAGKTLDASTATSLGDTLTVDGSLINNGTLKLPQGTTAEAIKAMNITGNGAITAGDKIYMDGVMHVYGGDVSGTGLDFSATVPTTVTAYKAGEGRIFFTPADGETPATLELNNAALNVTGAKSTVYLPRSGSQATDVNIILTGENRITTAGTRTEQPQPGDATNSVISAGWGTVTFSGGGSLCVQTHHPYGISASVFGGFRFNDVAIDMELTGKNANGYAAGTGIVAQFNGVDILDSTLKLWGEGSSKGIYIYGASDPVPKLDAKNSTITVRSSAEVLCNENGPITIDNSKVDTMSTGGGVWGFLRTSGTLTIQNGSDVVVKMLKSNNAIASGQKMTVDNSALRVEASAGHAAINIKMDSCAITGTSVVTLILGKSTKAFELEAGATLSVAETATLTQLIDASSGLDLSTPPKDATDYVAKEGTLRWEPTLGEDDAVTGGTLTLDGAEMAGDLIVPSVPVTLKTVSSASITGAILGNSSDVSLTVDGAELEVNNVWFAHEDDILGALTLKNNAQITIPAGEESQAVRVGTLQVGGSKLTASGSGPDGVPVIYLADAFSATDGATVTVSGGDVGVYSAGTITVDSSSKLVTDTTQAAVVVVDKTNALTGEAALDLPIPGGHERASVNDEDATYWSVVSSGGSLSVDETGVVTGAAHGRLTFEKPAPPPPSGGGSNTTTSTEKNPDGSTTTTVTNKTTGTVTETTKHPDGKVAMVETKKDGTVTEKVTASDGTKTEQVKKPDGSLTATETRKDGTKLESATTAEGKTTATVTVPAGKEGATTVVIPTPAKPAPGEVAVIVKEDGTKEVVKTSVATEDGLKITIPDGGKLEIIDNSKTFGDVADSAWYADAVAFASSREIFGGVGKGNFAPETNMTRAMLWTVLARFDGQDISGGANWYENAQAWAKESGISDGSGPDDGITREQLAVILYRYAGSAEVGGMALSEFGDADSVSAWAADAMLWCVDSGILNGSGGKLNPNGAASRAEVAATLHRYVVLMAR